MHTRSNNRNVASYAKLYKQLKIIKNEKHQLTPQLLLKLCRSQFESGYFDYALNGIARLLQGDPAFIDAYCLQSKILDNKGDAIEAVKCLLMALLAGGSSVANAVVMEQLKPYSIISIHHALTSLPAEDSRFLVEQFLDESTALGKLFSQHIAKDMHSEKAQAGLNYYKLIKHGVNALFKEKIEVPVAPPVEEFRLQDDIVIPMAINFC